MSEQSASDGRSSERRDYVRALAVVLIAAGVLWALAAIGFVPTRYVRAATLLWPILVIGVGFDLVGARRPVNVPYGVLAVAAMAVAAAFVPPHDPSIVRAPPEQPQATEPRTGAAGTAGRETDGPRDVAPDAGPNADGMISEPIGDARRAELTIDVGDMPLTMTRGELPDTLLVARAAGPPLEVRAAGRAVRRVALSERGSATPAAGRASATDDERAALAVATDLGATVQITDRIPIELDVAGHAGPVRLDLSGLDIAELRYAADSGPTEIALPQGGPERYDARIVGGAGTLHVRVPQGARANLRLDLGDGPADLVYGSLGDTTTILRTGAGPVLVTLPADARVRVVVDDPAAANLSLPSRLEPVRGAAQGEQERVFETPGYRPAPPAIEIRIDEAGSGPIVIR